MKLPARDTYKVTRFIPYGGAKTFYGEHFFRWYWQANLCSFLLHHVLGYSCNTWKKNT